MSKGRITESTINDIFNSVDIVDIVGKHVELKKSGANYSGCCPFHNEKTPSFIVSPSKQIYKCFGCGESGNAVSFLMNSQNMSYPESLEYIAGVYNIVVEYSENDEPNDGTTKEDKDKLKGVLLSTIKAYKKEVDTVADYLEERGFTKDDIIQWNIGYAPKGGKFITDKVVDAGYFSEAEQLFLCKSKSGKNYDVLQDRVTFPLQDVRGNFIGVSGRLVTENKKFPKYINPSNTDLYKKEYTWYGLNFAMQAIRKKGFATVVEGYTDVIAMHRKNINNTVASCGTSITESQVKLLKRFTKKVLLAMDGDKAGKKAIFKYIDLFVENGFSVYVKLLPNKQDPDEYLAKNSLGAKMRFRPTYNKDAVTYKISELIKSAKTFDQKADTSETIAILLSKIENAVLREGYVGWIGDIYKDFKKPVADLLKEKVVKVRRTEKGNVLSVNDNDKSKYTIPKEVKASWEDLKQDILKYGMFFYQKTIYIRRGSEDSYYFRKVSNFQIQIIQHMEDEKKPLKLVSLQNIHGRKRTFDTPSEDFVTELGFKKMITGKGNFNWQGDNNDFVRLTTKLYDEMGDGRMITVLGWQEEGFFVFNNVVIVDGRVEKLDQHGCFDYKGSSFYVPSGNHIYANNPTKFIPQKRAAFYETDLSFNDVATQMIKVHRKHAYNALLFTVASTFSDIIYNKVSFFPLLFLYGEPSSGKDNLIECCQSFFGRPQTPITITGKANTDKAKIRKFAQFRNMIGHMTEYANGNEDTDQMMKSFWDRVGYERGTIDSAVGTESIAIEMSVIFTGNDYPTNDALITRIVTEEMNKTDFTDEEKNEYEKLKELVQSGISSLSAKILKFRKQFEENFRKEFKTVQLELRNELKDLGLPDRMIANASVLGATYKLTNKELSYGFMMSDWVDHLKKSYQAQINKMQTGSVVSKFWDCFFEGVRAAFDTIEQHTEFDIEEDKLYLNFKLSYPKYQKIHFNLFKQAGLSKSVLLDKLKKSDAFIEMKSTHRYGSLRTSAFVFDLNKIGIKDELISFLTAKNGTAKQNPGKLENEPQNEELPFN